ncbi:uncharacterized protein Tco025E_09901 [Trypanosoma conorhini]|uniref:Uncharacterized protein n=1 Tax=Trypanosoma conorhini TaxID=83891 RepID=A0A3R7K8F1_9TRYP|nr:uncharacterized protein Tco025E_09901 [Trypanosoma conorhini]RNE95830.1 hypothetical protein Tco025E_09901 [Trypanosoma conorhini]
MQRRAPQREIRRGGAHSRQGVGALVCGGRLAIRRRNRQTGGARGVDCVGEAAACRLPRHRPGAPLLPASNRDIAETRSSLLCEAAKQQVPAPLQGGQFRRPERWPLCLPGAGGGADPRLEKCGGGAVEALAPNQNAEKFLKKAPALVHSKLRLKENTQRNLPLLQPLHRRGPLLTLETAGIPPSDPQNRTLIQFRVSAHSRRNRQ